MKRREFITLPAKCLGGLLVYTMAGLPIHINEAEGTVSLALQFFTAAEARTIAAACERIFPSDESGPGAKQAGVIIYIDGSWQVHMDMIDTAIRKVLSLNQSLSMAIKARRIRKKSIVRAFKNLEQIGRASC